MIQYTHAADVYWYALSLFYLSQTQGLRQNEMYQHLKAFSLSVKEPVAKVFPLRNSRLLAQC